MKKQHNYTVMHWGTWQVESREGEIVAVKPVPWDKNPSRIGQSLPDAVTSQTRIRRPAVRAGYLQHGPASREGRGKEPFVEVSWEVALDLLAREPGGVRPLPAIARFALGETEVRSALPSAGLFPAPPTPTDPDAA